MNRQLATDALRLTRQDLETSIRATRARLRRGMAVSGKKYLATLRRADELRQAGLALGASGPLFDVMMPIPFTEGFVGLAPHARFRREWQFPHPAERSPQ